MKHIDPRSTGRPAPAALWQDVACQIIDVVWEVMDLGGAEFPFLNFLHDKCTITPETQ